jgi:hypothetical protein
MSDFIRKRGIRDDFRNILVSRVLGFKDSPEYQELREYELEIPGVVCSAFAKFIQRLHQEQMNGDKTEAMEKKIQSAHDVLEYLASSHETKELVKEEAFESFDDGQDLLDAIRQHMGPMARRLFDEFSK